MSKITFRADDDLVERVEALETSKSEVMRDALRTYLDGRRSGSRRSSRAVNGENGDGERDEGEEERGLDELVGDRLDAMVESRLDEATGGQDVNVTVHLTGDAGRAGAGEGSFAGAGVDASVERARGTERPDQQSGIDRWTAVDAGGEGDSPGPLRSREPGRQCPQCGETVRGDHVYCPNCGEKATRRIFCDCGDELRSDWAYCPGCGRRTPSADVLDQ